MAGLEITELVTARDSTALNMQAPRPKNHRDTRLNLSARGGGHPVRIPLIVRVPIVKKS
jgi:hypothetical protein